MLIQRILTAIPLAVLVVWVILFQPTRSVDYLLTLVTFIAAVEWAGLSLVKVRLLRYFYAGIVVLIPWLFLLWLDNLAIWLVYAAVIWWFSLTYYLKRARPRQEVSGIQVDKLLIALIVIPATFIAMHFIHAIPAIGDMPAGRWWLMYALALVWVADIGAYFSGKRFGKIKLSPQISPGKTREGLYGALLLTTLYTLTVSYFFNLNRETAILLLLLSVMITLVSVTGDLYVSFLKREAGLKDSGKLLPGHGGMLDRIDSVLAAMPVFIAGFYWLISPLTLS